MRCAPRSARAPAVRPDEHAGGLALRARDRACRALRPRDPRSARARGDRGVRRAPRLRERAADHVGRAAVPARVPGDRGARSRRAPGRARGGGADRGRGVALQRLLERAVRGHVDAVDRDRRPGAARARVGRAHVRQPASDRLAGGHRARDGTAAPGGRAPRRARDRAGPGAAPPRAGAALRQPGRDRGPDPAALHRGQLRRLPAALGAPAVLGPDPRSVPGRLGPRARARRPRARAVHAPGVPRRVRAVASGVRRNLPSGDRVA